MIIIKKEKIVHGIKIVKNRDFFLQDKNRFERTQQLWLFEVNFELSARKIKAFI